MGRPVAKMDQEALDPAVMQELLHTVIRERYGTSVSILSIDWDHLTRGVYRYRLQLAGPDRHFREPLAIIGKVYDDPRAGQRSFEIMQQLREKGFAAAPPQNVHIPEVFRYLPELRLLLMQEAPGKPLKKLVKKQTAGAEHLQHLAATMAKLHGFPLVLGDAFTIEEHLKFRCNDLAAPLAEAFPAVREDIQWLLDIARQYQRQWGIQDFALAHGDFHLGQVHVHREDYWLLDLDPLHYGDPAYDVAMVLFILKQEAAKRKQTAYIATLRDAFIEAYFLEMDWKIAERIPLQEAMIHLKRACKRFYWQDEKGWAALIPRQIRQAVQCVKMMTAHEPPRSVAALKQLNDRCPVSA